MTTSARIVIGIASAAVGALGLCNAAMAGDYYVYACSSYRNTAPAFIPWTDADHLSLANECMQPSPSGGYRSLEINNPPTAVVSRGKSGHWIAYSPSPAISIVGAYTPANSVLVDCALKTDGFTAQYFWGDGAQSISYLSSCDPAQGYGVGTEIARAFGPSSYFGWGVTCALKSSCWTSSQAGALLGVHGIRLTAQENDPPIPTLTSDILLDQARASHWIRGGGWPVGYSASDPSGVCGTDLLIDGQATPIDATRDANPNTASFTQCWPTDTASGTLNTNGYPDGVLTIAYSARNAANVTSSPTETLRLDNTPVTLALSTPNDPDTNTWVNHSVQVDALASAGPSGIGATNCNTNNDAGYSYPANGITIDGTGIWTVSCRSSNNAFDVTGQPATSPTQAVTVRIDEAPPKMTFAALDPADPQAVVVNTSDGQSGVASGQLAIRPAAGGGWQSLATQFDGAHLLAQLNDAMLAPGRWTVQATSCDKAGNCASIEETVKLPLRMASVSSVGFARPPDPPRNESRCAVHLGGRHHSRRHSRARCRLSHTTFSAAEYVGFGRRAHLHGLLTTVEGAPIPHASVNVLSAPDNGISQYTEVAAATTNARGRWSVTLPSGPSRLVTAVYAGSATIQPSEGWARVIVPAAVRVLRLWPRRIPWGGQVHIKAELAGGYLPPDGALVRLRLGYGNAKTTYGVQEHVEGGGVFEVTNTFGPGPPGFVIHYWLQECTLPQGDYPFAPACGPRTVVTVGG